MCASCGCGDPENDHGDQRNILLSQVVQAAQAANLDLHNATQNIHDMAKGQVPIETVKKLLMPETVKDWAEWDAEREAEEEMEDAGASGAQAARHAIEERPRTRVVRRGSRFQQSHQNRRALRTSRRALWNHLTNGPNNGGHGFGGGVLSSLVGGLSAALGASDTAAGGKADKEKPKAAHLRAVHNVLHVIQPIHAAGHDHSHRAPATAQNSNPGIGKLLKGIVKRLQKDETGRFTGTSEDIHSHRQSDGGIVTHTHDGEKGHTHPGRNYGPSFHHR